MATTSEKITYLNETKSKIKDNINLTGANITNEDTFRSYAGKLKQGLLDILNKGNDYLYNNFPQLNGEGQNMSLTPTLEAPIKSELLGNTSQNGTPTPDTPVEVKNATGRQVVKISNGSQEQNYTINLGNIELCKIGDYQDRIYKDNGKWYLEKNIGKYTFTGNENWNVQATDNNFTTFQRPDILPSTAKATNFQQGQCLSNYFKTAITWNIWTNTNVGIDAYVNRILITIPSSIATTKTQLNQWLQEHNVYLDYVLATPTVEEITDSTLLNDLNNLEDAKSYNGTTNITITAETPADIKITALKNE